MHCVAMAVAMADRGKCCNSRRLGCIAMVDRTGDALCCNGGQYIAMVEGMLQWQAGKLYEKVQWDIAMCSGRPTTVNGATPKNGSVTIPCLLSGYPFRLLIVITILHSELTLVCPYDF